MEGNSEDKVADGSYDHLIMELIRFLKDYQHVPFLIRIGYEFEGSWNNYDPENFKTAFRRIVDRLDAAQVKNYATCMASASFNTSYQTWETYYPGDRYVDWMGYTYWEGDSTEGETLRFARDRGKPIFIAESTPRTHFLDKVDGQVLWEKWYVPFFRHIEANQDVVKAVSYINCDWDAQPMWTDWGNTRIEINGVIKKKWQSQLQDPLFINHKDKPYNWIGFQAP